MNSARLRYVVSVYYWMRTDITSLSVIIHDHPIIHSHPRIVIHTCFFGRCVRTSKRSIRCDLLDFLFKAESRHQVIKAWSKAKEDMAGTWKFDPLEKDICIGKPSFSGAMLVSGRVSHGMESKMFQGASLWILSPRVVSPQEGWCRNMEGLWPWWRNRISIPTGKEDSRNQA